MPLSTDHAPARHALWIGLAFLLLAVIVILACILRLNEGHLTYTLDDPYIHMALAEKIRQGHYGISLQEASAPASSILWPFLLSPFMGLPGADYLPFLANLVCALATVILFWQILGMVLQLQDPRWKAGLMALGVILLILVTNLAGLIFTGMEHSLQVLAAALLIRGLIRESESGRADGSLALGAIAGPLIRYENLALSAAGLLYLFCRGHRKYSLALGAVIGLALGGFSLFLRSLDLHPLPTSVLAKAEISGAGDLLARLAANPVRNLGFIPGIRTLAAMAVLLAFMAHPRIPARERWLAGSAALAAALHFAAGSYGWFHRYEIANWTFLCLAILYSGRRLLSGFAARRTWAALPIFLAGGLAGLPYIRDLPKVPLAANNIFEQQYQMHRFVVDYYRAPVAVMDIGYVAYGNPNHVVDLWGLASKVALRHIQAGDKDWMGGLLAAQSVGLAIVFELPAWQPPPGWIKLAEMGLSRPRITPAMGRVAFYAVDSAAAGRILPLLADFRKTLPQGISMEIRAPLAP